MSGQPSHGVDPTPEISAADNNGVVAAPAPGATAAAPATASPSPTQAGQALPIGGSDGAQPSIYKPQGIADHLLGQDDRGTIDKLLTAYTGARETIAKGAPPVPAAKDYQFNWSDNIKQVGIAPNDPALEAFRSIANEFKLTQDQVGLVPKFLDTLVEKGLIEKPFDAAGMLSSLAPDDFRGSDEEKQARGGQRLTAAENWIKQLGPNHGFDDDMKGELRLFTTSKAGVRILETMMKGGMVQSFSPGGGGQGQAVSKSDLDARVADPRNDAYGTKFDPAFAAETKKLFKEMYPDS